MNVSMFARSNLAYQTYQKRALSLFFIFHLTRLSHSNSWPGTLAECKTHNIYAFVCLSQEPILNGEQQRLCASFNFQVFQFSHFFKSHTSFKRTHRRPYHPVIWRMIMNSTINEQREQTKKTSSK